MQSTLSNSRKVAWTAWAIVSIFYSFQYILRVMPNVMLDDLMLRFNISALTFGQFSGVYYIGYSLMHLPLGIMLDRFGPRKVMGSSILLTVIGLTPILFTTHWIYPVVGRFLIGLGSSAAIIGVFKILRMFFAEAKFTRMLSLSVTIGLIGAIYGGGPLSLMHKTLGYQFVVYTLIATGLLLALTTYFVLPNNTASPQRSILSDVKEVFSNPKVITCCLLAGLMVGPLEGFADVWGASFLKGVYGFESTFAASLTSMIFIGMCFGSPILSLIAEKVGYLKAIIGSGVVMAVVFTSLIFFHLSSSAIIVNFIAVGVCCAYQILAIYKASTYVREQVAGLTTAVANMIIMTFGYAFHTIIGNFVDLLGGPTSPKALTYGIAVIPIALCLAIIGYSVLTSREKVGIKTI